MSKVCDIHLFTASEKEYADHILKKIDPKGTIFKNRWYKDSCTKLENGQYIKSLARTGLPLNRSILVDNSTFSFGNQMLNGVPIVSYLHSQPNDMELVSLKDFVLHLNTLLDVRKALHAYFKWWLYQDAKDHNTLFEKLFSG